MLHLTRHHIDVTLALLAAMVSLYFRLSPAKREAFEKRYPRFAAFLGILAGFLPFFPQIAENAAKLLNPNAHSADIPDAPWSESPQDTTEKDNGNGEQNP